MSQSPKYHLNQADLERAGWTFIHTLIATAVFTALALANNFQVNSSTTTGVIILNVLPVLTTLAKQYLSGPVCQCSVDTQIAGQSAQLTTQTPAQPAKVTNP